MSLAWLLVTAWAAEPAYYDGDVDHALRLLARDADRTAEDVRPAPLWFGERLDVVGGLGVVRCDTPVSGLDVADHLADAERWAGTDALDAAADAVQQAIDALPCLDVPVRAWEAARAHDLASALDVARGRPRDVAVAQARQARAYDPDHAFVHQVDADVLTAVQTGPTATSTLWLPPGLRPGEVLVDGRPVGPGSVALTPGRHLVQALGARVTTLAVDVPATPAQGVLLTAAVPIDAIDLDDAADRAWLVGALARWGPLDRPAWVVVRDRVWRTEDGGWFRYDRRPPRAVRPTLLALLGSATAGAATVAVVEAVRFGQLGACGTDRAGPGCVPYVDPVTGLILDADGWGAARRRTTAWALGFAGATALTGSLVAVVATRSRAPHAVQVAVDVRPEGAGLRIAGTWGPR
ncbi:MAG: hypothetical protein H6733_14320 [Alphaproteobacteria bacterium]|nr:hypothetical protein [Alphaproteobacteria bacterium]